MASCILKTVPRSGGEGDCIQWKLFNIVGNRGAEFTIQIVFDGFLITVPKTSLIFCNRGCAFVHHTASFAFSVSDMHCICNAYFCEAVGYDKCNTNVLRGNGMGKFQIPSTPPTVNKTIRFPSDVVTQVEQVIQGKECTFSAFVIAAVRAALEDLNTQDDDV